MADLGTKTAMQCHIIRAGLGHGLGSGTRPKKGEEREEEGERRKRKERKRREREERKEEGVSS